MARPLRRPESSRRLQHRRRRGLLRAKFKSCCRDSEHCRVTKSEDATLGPLLAISQTGSFHLVPQLFCGQRRRTFSNRRAQKSPAPLCRWSAEDRCTGSCDACKERMLHIYVDMISEMLQRVSLSVRSIRMHASSIVYKNMRTTSMTARG